MFVSDFGQSLCLTLVLLYIMYRSVQEELSQKKTEVVELQEMLDDRQKELDERVIMVSIANFLNLVQTFLICLF